MLWPESCVPCARRDLARNSSVSFPAPPPLRAQVTYETVLRAIQMINDEAEKELMVLT